MVKKSLLTATMAALFISSVPMQAVGFSLPFASVARERMLATWNDTRNAASQALPNLGTNAAQQWNTLKTKMANAVEQNATSIIGSSIVLGTLFLFPKTILKTALIAATGIGTGYAVHSYGARRSARRNPDAVPEKYLPAGLNDDRVNDIAVGTTGTLAALIAYKLLN